MYRVHLTLESRRLPLDVSNDHPFYRNVYVKRDKDEDGCDWWTVTPDIDEATQFSYDELSWVLENFEIMDYTIQTITISKV